MQKTRSETSKMVHDILNQMRSMKRQKRRIIYIDETVFTKRTISSRTYSSKEQNIVIDDGVTGCPSTTVIAAVSREKGVDHIAIQQTQINSKDFIAFITTLIKHNKNVPLCLFMDNHPAHRSKETVKFMDYHDIKYIFNVSYSPQFNPIESVFSKVKMYFKKRRLNVLTNKKGQWFNINKEIRQAFRQVTIDDVES